MEGLYNDQCWYKIINDKFKVNSEKVQKYGIITFNCVECKFSITSLSYQQNCCGSRYCKDCFEKLKPKYYCLACKEEDLPNIHKREDIFADNAMKKDLEKMSIKCPDCNSEMKLINLEEHVRNGCEKGWKVCSLCDDMYKKNTSSHVCKVMSLQVHDRVSPYKLCDGCGSEYKDIKDHICNINWDFCCPFGCEIENLCTIQQHRLNATLKHLDKACAIMKEFNLSEIKINQESALYPMYLEPTIELIKETFKYQPKEVLTLKKEIDNLKKEMIEEREINEIVKMNIQNQTFTLQNTSFDGTIMWKIDNFAKIKDDAIKGVHKSIFSPPFYSSRSGYKMCLRLYPNGDTSAYGVAMSLFLVIMKGNFDSMLKWPFKQKVTFILIDPEFKTNWIDAFIPSENMSSFSRPRTDMNIPSGSSYFIKFEDMSQNTFKYAKDNTVFIKCIVDCSDLN